MVQRTSLIRVHFRDNDGAEAHCQVNFPSSVPISTLWSIAPSWAGLIQAVSSAVCIGVDVIQQFNQTPIGTPSPSSDKSRSGVFIFQNTASALFAFRVPSIDQSYILSSGPFANIGIDTTIITIDALVSALIGGYVGVYPCDVFGVDLTALSQAFVEQY